LPGSTPARKLIVDRALKYLDRLAREEGRDPGLEEDLASAYIRVGDVQGGPNGANLGDRAGALASYQKALGIRQALAAANPTDLPARRRLAEIYRRIATQKLWFGSIVEASDTVRQGLAIDQAIAADPRHAREDEMRLAIDYGLIGDLLAGNGTSGSLDDDRGALENHRKSLEMASTTPEDNTPMERHSRAVKQVKIAADLTRLGERDEALRLLEQALPVVESLAAAGNSMARGQAPTLQERIGDTLLLTGDPAAALPHYRTALELRRSQLAQDPQNANFRVGTAGAYAGLGFALARSGKYSEGLGDLQAGERILRGELDQHKENGSNRAELAIILIWSAETYRMSNNRDQALAKGAEALDIYQSLLKAEPADSAARLNLAASQNFLARIWLEQGKTDLARKAFQEAVKLAGPTGVADGKSEAAKYVLADGYAGLGAVASSSDSLNEAQSWYQRSASVWERVAHPCPLNPNGFPTPGPTRLRADLARIDSAIARTRSIRNPK
jgi:tetratricopeptide (TPR) repeat protein